MTDNVIPFQGHGAIPTNLLDKSLPIEDSMEAARLLMKRFYTMGELQTLKYHKGVFHEYEGAAYRQLDPIEMRNRVWTMLDKSRRIHNAGNSKVPDWILARINPKPDNVNSIFDALRAVSEAPFKADAPTWLMEGQPPAEEICVLGNGLLHVPSRVLLPHTPAFFSLSASDVPYEPDAAEPCRWLTFMDEIFDRDCEAIATLRQLIGYYLTHDTRFQKIGFLKGPPRSGKGTILWVIEQLIGTQSQSSLTISSMGRDYGKQSMIGKKLVTFPDARFTSGRDAEGLVETLLSVSGEDSVNIPRKYLVDWNGRLYCKFLIVSNDVPEFRDSSTALLNRLVVVCTQRHFLDREDVRLKEKLKPELPGILNWALGGHMELYANNTFMKPESSGAVIRTMHEMASPILAFIERYCVVDPNEFVGRDKLFSRWATWCTESRGMSHVPGFGKFRGLLQGAVNGFDDGPRTRIDGQRTYTYKGLRLKTNDELDSDL